MKKMTAMLMVASLTAAALCSCGQKTEKETPAGAET